MAKWSDKPAATTLDGYNFEGWFTGGDSEGAPIELLDDRFQGLNAKLTALAALANAAGVLRNDGSGNFSYVDLIRYYPAITGLTGGGSTNLDGLATTAMPVRTLIHLMREVDGFEKLETWRLATGTDAEDAAGGIVRPDDYHASTNAKVWKMLA